MPKETATPPILTSAPSQIAVTAQYIKDLSFESPQAPHIFSALNTSPELSIGVNLRTRSLADNTFEVLLLLRLEAQLQGKAAFIVELAYGGVFVLSTASEEQTKLLLLVECPKLLFPFARSIISEVVREGGFPQVLITPIDFASLYQANKDNVGVMTAAGAA